MYVSLGIALARRSQVARKTQPTPFKSPDFDSDFSASVQMALLSASQILKQLFIAERKSTYADYQSAEPLPAPPLSVPIQHRAFFPKVIKRATDLAGALSGLLLLSPLLVIVACIIKLTSTGPVLFKQTRIGLGGKPFNMYKFRSMVADAPLLQKELENLNEAKGPVFKIKNDPRITRIGRFIRAYSIDELPQLLSILKGDMSIVGPRPPVLNEVLKYEPWQLRRLSVTPGLTCIWQTSGRSNICFDEWMKMDLQYIDQWSYGLDIKLILKTIAVVLKADGAY